jgi:hypothetical protein
MFFQGLDFPEINPHIPGFFVKWSLYMGIISHTLKKRSNRVVFARADRNVKK